jgi:class 3 adenylate cyclase/tetratricopeptide (TPR) repeat protein
LRRGGEEVLADARLARGEHAALVGDLEQAVAAEPLRERRWAQLMLALYRYGRQADALRAYQRLRGQLAEQLGIEPSPELKGLEEAVLLQKPELDWQPPTTAESGGPRGPDGAGPSSAQPTLDPLDLAPPGRKGTTVSRHVVTFLFTDIEASTRLWERYPARMAAVLERHDRLVGDLIATEGGRVFKKVGDAVHAVFVSPSAAVRAALAIQAGVANADWGAIGRLALRIGVYTGESELDNGEWRGRSLNRCARLRDAAATGQIIASHATVDLVGDDLADRAVITNLGVQRLRGVPRAEAVHLIESRTGETLSADIPPAPVITAGVAGSLPAPLLRACRPKLIGRAAEFDRIYGVGVDAPTSRVVLITGEAGVGKTRLAAAVASRAADEGASVLYGRCDEGLRSPYQPFIEALSSYIDRASSDLVTAQLGATGNELVRLLPGLAALAPWLAAPTTTEPEGGRWLLFQAAANFLDAIANAQAMVLVIDDLHWAEPATLLLLRHLARADIHNLLIVATARSAESVEPDAFAQVLADLAREHLLTTVVVGGLNSRDVATLVADRLQRPADKAFAHAVQAETGGNPFFIHELISHLGDLGVLTDTSSWPSAIQLEQAGTSEGVRQVLAGRLRQLELKTRDLLAVAAVAGSEFHAVDLARTMRSELEAVISALEEAATGGLIIETGREPGAYRFAHALVRHTLYDNLSGLRRTHLHWQLAESISGFHDAALTRLNQIAYHCSLGLPVGDPARAVDWLHRAADQALSQVAFEEAIQHYRGALAALDLCPDDLDLRYDLLMGVAESAAALADFDLSQQVGLLAADIAEAAGDATRFCRAVYGYDRISTLGAENETVLHQCHRGLMLADPSDSAERAVLLAIQGYTEAGRLYGDKGAPAGQLSVREALAMARRLGDEGTEAVVLGFLGGTLFGTNSGKELLAIAERVIEIGERRGNDVLPEGRRLYLEGFVYRDLALAAIQVGQTNLAAGALQRTEMLAQTQNYPLLRHNALMLKAAVLIASGEFVDAKRLAREARGVGDQRNLVVAFGYAAQVSAIRAEQGQGQRVLANSDIIERDEIPAIRAWRTMLAALRADLGDIDDAAARFDALAADNFKPVPRDWAFPLSARYLAETCVQLGRHEEAARLLALVEPYRGQLFVVTVGTTIEGAADRSLAQLYVLLGRNDDADRYYEAAWRLEDSMGFKALATRTRYWHARLLSQSHNAGDRNRAIELLQEARATSLELRMVLLHEQAENLFAVVGGHGQAG